MSGVLPVHPVLLDFARDVVRAEVGADAEVARVEALQGGTEDAVLRLTLAGVPRRLVLKLSGSCAGSAVDFRRTATVARLAEEAGAPVAAVLAVDTSRRAGPWAYLLQEHVEGTEWARVRPVLDEGQTARAHREIAAALLAVQSVRFDGFGELDAGGQPAGGELADALRRRADLRIGDERRRELFLEVLEREAALFSDAGTASLSHDDLHHANVVFRLAGGGWHLAGLLDWDKAWAGPAESDVARMALWDDMTGPGFWEAYRTDVPAADGWERRALVHQLLWCLEYDVGTARHAADTTAVCRRLGVQPPPVA